ncbi:MAG: response regulator [Lentimicrobiaceae bacterium]|nr:response regulator [Lentimicrobiaceae bacterium]MCB9023384.1 response regulator [Lentimicrobiaceae bacterium]MCO5266180.1 response regulator [Lentimicrobium sp.]
MGNRQYYRSLIDGKRDCCFLADFEGDILLLNRSFEELSGYNELDLIEISVRDIFFTFKEEQNPLDNRQLFEFSESLFLLNASNYLISINLEFKEIEGQKFLGIVHKINTPSAKSKPAALPNPTSKEAGVSISDTKPNAISWSIDQQHEVRTALNGIIGFGSILKKENTIQSDFKISSYIDGILKNGNRLKSIIDNKDKSEPNNGARLKFTYVDLGVLFQKFEILLSNEIQLHEIDFELKKNFDTKIFIDEERLTQILYFLIQKAIRYTRNNKVSVNALLDNNTDKLIIIIDNIGMDIPQSIINSIRRESTQNEYDYKKELYEIVPSLTETLNNLNLLEGKISFQTGTHFGEIATLTFAINQATTSKELEVSLENEIKIKNSKILVIEDDKINAKVLDIFINNFAEIVIAYSGNEALNLIEMHFNKGILFNTILMDIGLPEPWNGISLKREIEQKWPEYMNVPFIAQTAFSESNWNRKIVENNFKGTLIKPIEKLEVLRLLSKIL